MRELLEMPRSRVPFCITKTSGPEAHASKQLLQFLWRGHVPGAMGKDCQIKGVLWEVYVRIEQICRPQKFDMDTQSRSHDISMRFPEGDWPAILCRTIVDSQNAA